MIPSQIWDREYLNKSFMSGTKPQKSVMKFVKALKKEYKKQETQLDQESPGALVFDGVRVLDLGCGEGKNAFYFAERGAEVIGVDISRVAVENARLQARILGLQDICKFSVGSIGESLEFESASFDIVLDVTTSNALSTPERNIYLTEVHRILKGDGDFFVRALCKDGDINAKNLLKSSPSHETDTYIMPVTGLVERVFSYDDIMMIYSEYFDIYNIEKEIHYTTMSATDGSKQKYKRNFWILHMKNKSDANSVLLSR